MSTNIAYAMDERQGAGDAMIVTVVEGDPGIPVTGRMWEKCTPLDIQHPFQLTGKNVLLEFMAACDVLTS